MRRDPVGQLPRAAITEVLVEPIHDHRFPPSDRDLERCRVRAAALSSSGEPGGSELNDLPADSKVLDRKPGTRRRGLFIARPAGPGIPDSDSSSECALKRAKRGVIQPKHSAQRDRIEYDEGARNTLAVVKDQFHRFESSGPALWRGCAGKRAPTEGEEEEVLGADPHSNEPNWFETSIT